jgi:ATP-binding cassette subfamily C protein
MSRALAPIEQAVAQWQPFLNFKRALARLSNLLETTPSEERPARLPKPKGRVQVEALTCFAAGLEKPIVSGISFELTPGAGLGIIGPTGAGKSTVARALVGIWPNYRGTVRLDGATLQQWGRNQLGRHIGYLPQDVDLFDGTIADNIARFDKNLDSKAVIRAAQHANVHDLILGFPAGYNTVLSETGARLSAGQRQRIGLARALYRDPVLLVLDEPNSNLDAEGEAALVKAIEVTRERSATVVVVAHRPSALAALSELMMLRHGQCLAFGSRDEVLNKVIAKPSVTTGGLAVVSSRG